jgi:predicted XRE-type DNA-binding protein
MTVRRKISFSRRPDKTTALAVITEPVAPAPTLRVPRIAKLMALAIHFDQMVRLGKVADQSELARLVHVSQPRLTQIMNLNHLAPEIQEALLFVPAAERGRERIHERVLRPVVAEMNWSVQRVMWNEIARGAQ